MENNHVVLAYLAGIGAAMGLGNFLISGEPLVARLIFGRVILGSGASITAGSVYLLFPTLHPLALVGIASLTGLAGAAWLEVIFKRKVESMLGKAKVGEDNAQH